MTVELIHGIGRSASSRILVEMCWRYFGTNRIAYKDMRLVKIEIPQTSNREAKYGSQSKIVGLIGKVSFNSRTSPLGQENALRFGEGGHAAKFGNSRAHNPVGNNHPTIWGREN